MEPRQKISRNRETPLSASFDNRKVKSCRYAAVFGPLVNPRNRNAYTRIKIIYVTRQIGSGGPQIHQILNIRNIIHTPK